MKSIVPQLDANKILIKDSPKAKGGDVYAHTRSRPHKVPEGESTNTLTAAYLLTAEERQAIVLGADLYISQVTYATAPHDILVHVGAEAAATYFDVKVQTYDDMQVARVKAEARLRDCCESLVEVEQQLTAAPAEANPRDVETMERRAEHARKAVANAVTALAQARQNTGEIDG